MCFKCGKNSSSENRFCQFCSARLPDLPSYVEVKPPSSLLTYLRALRCDVVDERIDSEKLRESLLNVLNHMEKARETYLSKIDTLNPGENADNDKTISAMNQFIDAVNEMMAFFENGDIGQLSKGLEAAEIADINLNDSLQAGYDITVTIAHQVTFLRSNQDKQL